jgi:iron complex transport system substrate-binding protein
MKVLSLLPSATEIVYALSAEDVLCGVSCDCDHPEDASRKPVVSARVLPTSDESSPSGIDAMVRNQLAASGSIYTLDRSLIQALRPDVILARDLCRVCAVPSGDVDDALEVIGCRADVVSLDPHSLEDVLESIRQVGRALDRRVRAEELVASLRDRLERVRRATGEARPRRLVAVEWQEPLFVGGHWIPEMVEIAGGVDVLGRPAAPSRTVEWSEVVDASPEAVVFMPCGYDLDGAVTQLRELFDVDELRATPAAQEGNVFVVDSSSYFSRPGPRLVDGVEILAGILHPQLFVPPDPSKALRASEKKGRIVTSPLQG